MEKISRPNLFLVGSPNCGTSFLWKKLKEHKKMVEALKVGDEIATSGGIYGKIIKLTDSYAMIKISSNTEIKLQRNSINQILPKNTLDHLK